MATITAGITSVRALGCHKRGQTSPCASASIILDALLRRASSVDEATCKARLMDALGLQPIFVCGVCCVLPEGLQPPMKTTRLLEERLAFRSEKQGDNPTQRWILKLSQPGPYPLWARLALVLAC